MRIEIRARHHHPLARIDGSESALAGSVVVTRNVKMWLAGVV
jgi:hypothetical protein